jgi:uracil-DNA glycosylase family protein
VELQSDAEHEQHDPDFSELLSERRIGDETRRVRSDQYTSDQIASDWRETETVRDVAKAERRGERSCQREDQFGLGHAPILIRNTRCTAGEDMAKRASARASERSGSDDVAIAGDRNSAAPFVPATTSLRTLSAAAHNCRGCDLYKAATQVVFGAGPKTARVMFVGEQPGDQEDRQGEPFVGPAGALLDKALVDAGIPRNEVYVTNAVKHFKWEPRGKRRIHKKPRISEIKACRPWLEAELRAVTPDVVVCLGASAAQAVLGPHFKLMQQRGQVLSSALAQRVLATIHPSAVLRAPDSEGRRIAFESLVADLKVAARAIAHR